MTAEIKSAGAILSALAVGSVSAGGCIAVIGVALICAVASIWKKKLETDAHKHTNDSQNRQAMIEVAKEIELKQLERQTLLDALDRIKDADEYEVTLGGAKVVGVKPLKASKVDTPSASRVAAKKKCGASEVR